jgi:hypothetical protein
MQLNSLRNVVMVLDSLVGEAAEKRDRTGYFAALYILVTEEIDREVVRGGFQNGQSVERLALRFAKRYLDAVEQFRGDKKPSLSWQVAFDALGDEQLLVIQHLLLGMNAHINFDLAISTAETFVDAAALRTFRTDYEAINKIFSRLLDTVQARLARVSPDLGLLDELGGRTDEAILGFSLAKAREHAWSVAEMLVGLPTNLWRVVLRPKDLLVAGFGQATTSPLLAVTLRPIRATESTDVGSVIRALLGRDASVGPGFDG